MSLWGVSQPGVTAHSRARLFLRPVVRKSILNIQKERPWLVRSKPFEPCVVSGDVGDLTGLVTPGGNKDCAFTSAPGAGMQQAISSIQIILRWREASLVLYWAP